MQAEIVRLKAENEKLKTSNRRWMRIAGTDTLTGLRNKVFFTMALLPQAINKANADGEFIGCIIVAPDGLGEINEKYGRGGGDHIVKEVAEFLKGNVDADEQLVHFDGANFVILLADRDLKDAKRKGLALRAKISNRTFEFNGSSISLTLSVGVVVRTPSSEGSKVNAKEVVEEFLRRLETMLDQAKQQGGGTE